MAVNFWQNSIEKVLSENEKNSAYFENQKKLYCELSKNLDYYNETLSPSVMVPFCNRVIMKGNLIHTNEVMVSLGCSYFVKTSSKQAKEICRRRLMKTEAILQDLEKESTFLNNQLNSTNENVLSQDCKEIVEEYDEEREKQWKIKHRENLKIHRQKECEESKSLIADDYIEKLDILQLQEEIEMLEKSDPDTENKLNLNNVKAKFSDLREKNKFNCVTDEDVMKRLNELELEEGIENKLEMLSGNSSSNYADQHVDGKNELVDCDTDTKPINNHKENESNETIENLSTKHKEEFDLKESILLKRLIEVQNRKQEKCLTEEDLIRRIDYLEEQEKLNDELDRLYEEESIYSSEETEDDNNIVNNDETIPQKDHDENRKLKKRVSFAENTENPNTDTISINFSHSEMSSYNTETKSILKAPSDVYHSFPEYFQKKPKSIIKNRNKVKNEKHISIKSEHDSDHIIKPVSTSIVLGNVVEHKNDTSNANTLPVVPQQKPMSKFKSMRLSQKKNG